MKKKTKKKSRTVMMVMLMMWWVVINAVVCRRQVEHQKRNQGPPVTGCLVSFLVFISILDIEKNASATEVKRVLNLLTPT